MRGNLDAGDNLRGDLREGRWREIAWRLLFSRIKSSISATALRTML